MPEWLKTVIDAFTKFAPLGAVIVFVVALAQYIRSEAWKKTEFVAKLYKEFSENEDCKRALWLLQGDNRTLYYKDGDKLVSYPYDYDFLVTTLTDALDNKVLTPAQLHIRDTLDTFFVYLEQFERAIQRKLVSQNDVYPYFGYWIAILNGDPDMKTPKPVVDALEKYIKDAGFDDVEEFLKRKWVT